MLDLLLPTLCLCFCVLCCVDFCVSWFLCDIVALSIISFSVLIVYWFIRKVLHILSFLLTFFLLFNRRTCLIALKFKCEFNSFIKINCSWFVNSKFTITMINCWILLKLVLRGMYGGVHYPLPSMNRLNQTKPTFFKGFFFSVFWEGYHNFKH